MTKEAYAMVHDFTLVYVLDPGMGSQEDVLRQVAGSDCADATVGWGRPGHVGLAFSREASDRDAAVKLARVQMAQALPGAVLVGVDAA
ncbi:transcriptional regulator [Delftia tsuruhatensis]|uniref:transcriptional regulator n=1 Tax=Delftia tsuruhatensis TaxID=180282 RepID=UPI001F2EF488|nr:transcriptional regulator [Delftia tsuruhatensis]